MCEISVILLTNDSETFIERAIKSVLFQSFSDFELLIVGRGSVNKTLPIIHSFRDLRIKYVENKLDRVEALNWGLTKAKSKYIAFLDDYSLMHPDRLRIQYALMEENSNITICGSWIKHIDKHNLLHVEKSLSGLIEKPLLAFLDGNFLFYSTAMIRKSFLTINKLKYEEFSDHGSLKFGIEIAKKGGVFYVDNQLLQYSYKSNDQILLQNEKKQSQDSSQEVNPVLTSLIELNKNEYPEMQMILANFESLQEKNMLTAVEVITFFRDIFMKNKNKILVSSPNFKI